MLILFLQIIELEIDLPTILIHNPQPENSLLIWNADI